MTANWRVMLLLACAIIFCAHDLQAQVETARITGTIRDQSGGIVSGAQVTMTNIQTNISSETMTREDGTFESVPRRTGHGEFRLCCLQELRATRIGSTSVPSRSLQRHEHAAIRGSQHAGREPDLRSHFDGGAPAELAVRTQDYLLNRRLSVSSSLWVSVVSA
jgi:Carboxypeptidase regulatory-like domain